MWIKFLEEAESKWSDPKNNDLESCASVDKNEALYVKLLSVKQAPNIATKKDSIRANQTSVSISVTFYVFGEFGFLILGIFRNMARPIGDFLADLKRTVYRKTLRKRPGYFGHIIW